MRKLTFLAGLLGIIWICHTWQEIATQGTFFEEITEGDQLNKESMPRFIGITPTFHACSMNSKCEFVIKNIHEEEKEVTTLPESREGHRIWKKIQPNNDRTNGLTTIPRAYNSCTDAMEDGINTSQMVNLSTNGQTFQTWCDMTTDGGGWTVFQRRVNGSLSFEKTWQQYEKGFGDPSGNFWLGLEKIHLLTKSKNSTLRVDLINLTLEKGYAKYKQFRVGENETGYKLDVENYEGNIGDGLVCSNSMKFTTSDKDNDLLSFGNCAESYKGAWWYNKCCNSYLNSIYHNTKTESRFRMTWYSWRNKTGDIVYSEMKFR